MTNIYRDIKYTFWQIHNTNNPDDLDGLLARYKMLLKKYNTEQDKKIVAKIKKKLKKRIDL